MNTDDLIKQSRARFDHNVAKKVLKEKYLAKMIFVHNEGMFRAGPELASTLQACNGLETAVIIDLYENPVKINVAELIEINKQRWQEQMNAWLLEYEESRKKR